jgi:hypothetical protein
MNSAPFRYSRFILVLSLLLIATLSGQAFMGLIGYEELYEELGDDFPTGQGITVTQVEAAEEGGAFAPDLDFDEFQGLRIFVAGSRSGPASVHATKIGRILYGSETGLAPGVDHITVFKSDDWLLEGSLGVASRNRRAPHILEGDVQCHAWVGRLSDSQSRSVAADAVRRFDYVVERDGITAVVSIDNGAGGSVPDLLAHTHNGIVVGRIDGEHSSGKTFFEGIGRAKPDLVGPLESTSLNVSIVSSLAALLLETSRKSPDLEAAAYPAGIKAILMAGTRKDLLPSWEGTAARPLDALFGSGLVNVYRSYHILTSRRQLPGGLSQIYPLGWDVNRISDRGLEVYVLQVPDGTHLEDISICLAWNRQIEDIEPGGGFTPVPRIADMTLRLIDVDSEPFDLVGESASAYDNVEYIHIPRLEAGSYSMVVRTDIESDYALAWFSRPVVE